MATRKKPAPSAAYEAALAKLETSGLDAADFDKLRFEALDPTVTSKLHPSFKPLPALKLTYWDPFDLSKPLRGWPSWPPFYRIRYLAQASGFEALTDKKPLRYTNEPNAGVCAYFPPSLDWPTLLMNPDEPLIFTEGELKAAKACKEGFPTIGLGGVYNYRSSKLGLTFLNELERIVWAKRHVYIIFDSDFKTNEMVCQALNDLADELMKRGAIPWLVALPDVVEEGKTGLDDFLVSQPPEELEQLIHDRAQPLTLAKALWRLNSEAVYIHDPGLIVVQETGQRLSPAAFKDHAYATLDHAELVVKPDGTTSMRSVSAASAWLKWQLRREAGSMTYEPGKPQFIPAEKGSIRQSRWNVWPGWGVEPRAGDITPFLTLVDHLFTGTEPAAKEWFLRWCACPLQYPGTKMFSSVLLYGIQHGTGKSLIGYTLGKIYGKNFTEIDQQDLHAGHNEWAEAKQFVLGDDITGSNKREDNDILKKMISQKWLRINIKYVPSFVIPDYINYYFTSNQPDAFFLEDHDRRNFIQEVLVGPLSEQFYLEYELWLETGGAEAVFDYLLKLDLGDFNPAAPAYYTAAKDRMIADVKSDLGAWVARLAADPDSVLRVGEMALEGDLFTNRMLLQLYDPVGRTGTTANGLGREMRRAGFRQVANGQALKGPEGTDRYYAVRHRDAWLTRTAEEAIKHLTQQHGAKDKKAKY